MSKSEADILLIRKYLNGELDARTMHQMERRAQDDPFLMDALEGYEMAKGDQQKQLGELTERLKQRLTPKQEKRIIPLKWLSIAASILVIIATGGLLLFNNHNIKQVTAVVTASLSKASGNVQSSLKTDSVMPDEIAVLPPKPRIARSYRVMPDEQVSNAVQIAAPPVLAESAEKEHYNKGVTDTLNKDTTPLNEMIVMGYTTQKKKDATGSLAEIKQKDINQILQGKVEGVTSTPAGKSSMMDSMIRGQVIGIDDGLPLVGASVSIKGTKIAAVTDVNGKFKLPADAKGSTLVAGYIGYQTTEISSANADSASTIKLKPANSSLNEVIVMGYGRKTEDEASVAAAHPQEGWSSFKKYLKDNAISPDGKVGVVKLSFIVDHNGMVNNIKVIESLGNETDQKAVSLIDDGPDWVGNSNGKAEEVTVRIKFSKQKN